MKKNTAFFVLTLLFTVFLGSYVLAGGHGEKKPMKKGILLVAFGSSMPEAQVSFENIDTKVKGTFPNIPVRWAYTSHIIRHKLSKEGKGMDSVEVALAKMMDQGFTHVAVQSLLTIIGEEYHELVQNAHAFGRMAGGFKHILVGYPLLATEKDMERATKAILSHIPRERKGKDAVILMGHGTPHPANAQYTAMMYHLQKEDSNVFMGTVEGSPTIDDIKEMLAKKGVKKAYLMPFMSVAGDHARNDMAGDEEDSWKSILTNAGIKCVPILKGTGEYDDMVDIWVDHLASVLSHF